MTLSGGMGLLWSSGTRVVLARVPVGCQALTASLLLLRSLDGLVGMAIVGGMALGVAGLAGLIGLAVSKSKS